MSKIINEAPAAYISQQDIDKNPDLKRKISQASKNSSGTELEYKLPKIDNFKNFQSIYNLYANNKFMDFPNPDTNIKECDEFFKNVISDTSNSNNKTSERNDLNDLKNLDNEQIKQLYAAIKDIASKRSDLKLD